MLKLLDYETQFCKAKKVSQFSRFYFAVQQECPSDPIFPSKLNAFYEVVYWLLSISKSKKVGAYIPFTDY